MPLFRRCFCWKDVRTGSVAAGSFTLTFAFLQLLIQAAVWLAAAAPGDRTQLFLGQELTSEYLESVPYYLMFIPLAGLDFILVILSTVLLINIDKDFKGRMWLLPWVIFLPIYVLYETAANVYLGVYAYDGARLNWPFVIPSIIFFYWLVKLIVNIAGFLCVISRYQELGKYGRTLNKRASIANSFDRDYPGGYFNSMTSPRSHGEGRSGGYNGHHNGYIKPRMERDYRRQPESYDRHVTSMPYREPRYDYDPRTLPAGNGYYRY